MVIHQSIPSASNVFVNQPSTSSASVVIDESLNVKSNIFPHAIRRGLNKTEGPIYNEKGFLYGLQQGMSHQSLGTSVFESIQQLSAELSAPVELSAADISLSALYLHELHHRQVCMTLIFSINNFYPRYQNDSETFNFPSKLQIQRRGYDEMATKSIWQRNPVQELATLPEIRQERAPLLLHQDSSIRNSKESKYDLNAHLNSI